MYKIMIVTHGSMAESLKETLKMFTNDLEGIHTVGLDENGVESFKERLNHEAEACYEEGKELLVLADLFGGTPFNTCVLEIKNKYKNVEIITGVNLPILIESSLQMERNLKDIVKDLQQSAKESIILTECLGSSEDED